MANKPDKQRLYENFSQEIRRGVLVLAVLSQLSEPQYGYSLKQNLQEKGLEINEGTLYPLLRRLESQGVLESSWQVVDDARPRRYYHISENGETIQASLMQDWEKMIKVMNQLLCVKTKK